MPPKVTVGPAPGGASTVRVQGGRPWNMTDQEYARQELDHLKKKFEELKAEPLLVGTIVEIREGRMSLSFGPGNAVDIHAIADARVGHRVLVTRNTMQAVETIADEVPTGSIITVTRVAEHGMIEAEVGGLVKTFRSSLEVTKGERVIVDPSMTFVIGSLGMPPSDFSFAPKISVSWDDVGGHAEAKEHLREAIELPYSHPELFAAYGKRPVRGVLLSGPPGCGKTVLSKATATAIAKAHGKDASSGFIYVKGPELLSKWIGKSEESVRGLFIAAREHKAQHGYPAVVFMDECDSLLGTRDIAATTSLNATIVPQFLAEMDGLDDHAAIFILATNRPDLLDAAVTREGRIDRKVKVGRPSKEDAKTIFGIHLRDRPLFDEDYVERAVAELYSDDRVIRKIDDNVSLRLRDFVSGAMIAEIVERASTSAMLRDIEAGRKRARGITAEDLVTAVGHAERAQRDTNHGTAIRDLIDEARPR